VPNARVPTSSRRATLAHFLVFAILFFSLAACGTGSGANGNRKIAWQPGTPPAAAGATTAPTTVAQIQPTETVEPDTPTATAEPDTPTPTVERQQASSPTPTVEPKHKPNELGFIPVLEYHHFVTDPADEAQFYRPLDDFRADLQWLYDNDFYVIPLRDLVLNQIAAPAGKRPVVLTFDDSYSSQFRYLIHEDGSLEIDPNSAVGILEEFFTKYPDFGRGGFFAVLPHFCFDWSPDGREDDQTELCDEKLSFLIDNGYEVGNHTLTHESLYDLPDDEFKRQVAGAILALQEYDPRVTADILAMPFGDYPARDTHQQQREWLRYGFDYKGQQFKILGCLMVGANPTESPVSTEYDPIWIARIQAFDNDVEIDGAINLYGWYEHMLENPETVYVSDGDPNTITVPKRLPPVLKGTLDEAKIEAEGKTLIRY